ncbi:hypothetical protein WJX79_000032 [Trebouxia sp. C0005]
MAMISEKTSLFRRHELDASYDGASLQTAQTQQTFHSAEQRSFGPPDPLDADPLDLMASQAHLLDTAHATRLERGNSSNYPQQLEPLPPPSIQELDVGLPETAGSNGKPDDKEKREFQASGSQQEKDKAAERRIVKSLDGPCAKLKAISGRHRM